CPRALRCAYLSRFIRNLRVYRQLPQVRFVSVLRRFTVCPYVSERNIFTLAVVRSRLRNRVAPRPPTVATYPYWEAIAERNRAIESPANKDARRQAFREVSRGVAQQDRCIAHWVGANRIG